MPVFNVLRINQTHLAKVMVAKKSERQTKETADHGTIVGFMRWRNHIRKQLTTDKALTSCEVLHIFE